MEYSMSPVQFKDILTDAVFIYSFVHMASGARNLQCLFSSIPSLMLMKLCVKSPTILLWWLLRLVMETDKMFYKKSLIIAPLLLKMSGSDSVLYGINSLSVYSQAAPRW